MMKVNGKASTKINNFKSYWLQVCGRCHFDWSKAPENLQKKVFTKSAKELKNDLVCLVPLQKREESVFRQMMAWANSSTTQL